MKKILLVLLLLAMVFVFTSCDNGNGDEDLFAGVESTLTETVESVEDFNFIGTWDCRVVMLEYEDDYGTFENIQESVAVVTSTEVTQTLTRMQEKYICATQEIYDEMKTDAEAAENEGFSVSTDDAKRTITMTATKELLDEANGEVEPMPYADFVANFQLENDDIQVTTNSSRTAIKTVESGEGYSYTVVIVKR